VKNSYSVFSDEGSMNIIL